MAFNQPDILPSAAEAVYRALEAAPGKRLQHDSLMLRIIGDEKNNAGDKVVRETLRELRAIGAVQEQDGKLLVRESVSIPQHVSPMEEVVRRCVMDAATDGALWTRPQDDDSGPALTGASDLLRALAWLAMQQNAEGPWSFEGEASLSRDQNMHLPFEIVRNEERWRAFFRWATYLGFASSLGEYTLVPDPTKAMTPTLRATLRGRGFQRLDAVLAKVSETLPVLDGGAAQRGLREFYDPSWDAHVSPSMTLALTRLALRGNVEFDEGLGDAAKFRLANGKGAYHAIRWNEAA